MKKILIILSILNIFLICSCNNNKFTITWANYDGTILEVDNSVKKNDIPSYDGNTPVKPSDNEYSYTFKGWDKEIGPVTENKTYTAIFESNLIIIPSLTYNVTWKNYDGSIIKTDTFNEGTIPVFNGNEPTKPNNGNVSYKFSGWNPSVNKINSDVTYTAVFTEMNIISNDNYKPVLLNNTVTYGLYPQEHINDNELINVLDGLSPSNVNGWILYNNVYYTKITTKIYNNESYTYDDGSSIVDGEENWFKCSPIKWDVIKVDENRYTLVSDLLLDAYYFNETYINNGNVNANNYKESSIRTFLNNNFFNIAFALDNSSIQTNAIISDNNTLYDLVYLLSKEEYLDSSLGFISDNDVSNTRGCLTSDYTRAKGASINTRDNGYKKNGSYWTRSSSNNFDYAACIVNTGGYITEYSVERSNHCIRPAITIVIE